MKTSIIKRRKYSYVLYLLDRTLVSYRICYCFYKRSMFMFYTLLWEALE